MSSVRSATARFLGSKPSVHTRRRYKKDIMTWQRFCAAEGFHALDGSYVRAQAFADWLADRYTPVSVHSRFSGVRQWFDHLLAEGIVAGHGFREAKCVKRVRADIALVSLSDEDLVSIVSAAGVKGPRWEWLMGMVAFCGLDCAEALRVRSTDVRSWDGRTLVRVSSRRGTVREVPVDGRLELLTLGLASVFAPTTSLGGSATALSADRRSDYASVQLGKIASAAMGRPVSVQDLRRAAVRRQFDRGVSVAVIAKWMGHATDRWVRETLGLRNPVDDVSTSDVVSSIVVEPDGDRFGAGRVPDSLIDGAL
jgi:integrase